MYDFLTGPMLWLSLAVFFGGLAARVVWYVKGLRWNLDRVPYGHLTSTGWLWALKSVIFWLIPFGSRSWRTKPGFAALFFLLHFGLVLVPLFYTGHTMFLKQWLGVSWPAMPAGLADALTILAICAGVLMLLRRYALPEIRIITGPQDLAVMALSLAPLVTGYVAAHQPENYAFWINAHILTGEILLLAAPFTKLAHVALFFCSRMQLGLDYGTKRGGQKGRGLAW